MVYVLMDIFADFAENNAFAAAIFILFFFFFFFFFFQVFPPANLKKS